MGENKSRIEFLNAPLLLNKERVMAILVHVANSNGKDLKRLVYQFVSREKILDVNADHLNHHYETDIITFEYNKSNKVIGDVFVCYDVIKDNAHTLKLEVSSELHRVVFHGLLHLLGFKDATESEKLVMRKKEDDCLTMMEGHE